MNCTTCQHTESLHTSLAGCVQGEGNTYCSCTQFRVNGWPLPEPSPARAHDGATYDPAVDAKPLNKQQQAVFRMMSSGTWCSLQEIAGALNFPEASVSARLRDLRKAKWGGHLVERRRRMALGHPTRTWEYRLDVAK